MRFFHLTSALFFVKDGILSLQEIVLANRNMSRYFHDIWTYASITPAGGKAAIYR
jgi:hypothetical protein